MSRQHPFSQPVLGQRTSPFLQEKLSLLGCVEVFGEVPQRISSLLGIEVNQSQVYRTCQRVAEALDDRALNQPAEALSEALEQEGEQVYAMVDGSMVFTDDGWQEAKVGRIFQAAPSVGNEAHGWKMQTSSHYVAKRGHYTGFTAHFEQSLPPGSACRKVFVTDGAAWIGQWIAERYPGAVHILDLFHVCEKLASVAPRGSEDWLARQTQALLSSGAEPVMAELRALPSRPGDEIEKLMGYLENHKHQMDYPHYRKNGWMIGSGAIESAHRTLLQARMKRSGQRWANTGCDHMIKLRLAYQNNRCDLIQNLLKRPV